MAPSCVCSQSPAVRKNNVHTKGAEHTRLSQTPPNDHFIICLLHRILGHCLATEIKWNQRQKGFMKGDGVTQNLLLLPTLVNSHKEELQPLNLVFIAVKKAFESVSHQSAIKAPYRLGVPDPLLSHLHEYYSDYSIIFTVGNESSNAVRTTQGVWQGDPLSGTSLI